MREAAHATAWVLLGLVVASLVLVTALGAGGLGQPDRGVRPQWSQAPASGRSPAPYAVADPLPLAGRLRNPALLVVARDHGREPSAAGAGSGGGPRRRADRARLAGRDGKNGHRRRGRPVQLPAAGRRQDRRTETVWDAVARGDLSVTHGVAGLRLDLGGTVVPGVDPGGPQVRLGAIATTVPGIDLLVEPPWRPAGHPAPQRGRRRRGRPGRTGRRARGAAARARALGVGHRPDRGAQLGVYAAQLAGRSVAEAVGSFSYRWHRDGTVTRTRRGWARASRRGRADPGPGDLVTG